MPVIFDICGSLYLKKKNNSTFKNALWIINDSENIITDNEGNDIFSSRVAKIKEIQQALIIDFSLETLTKYANDLKDDFISNYLNINISKKTFNQNEIVSQMHEYVGAIIIHKNLEQMLRNPDEELPKNVDSIVVDYTKLTLLHKLLLFKVMSELNMNPKWHIYETNVKEFNDLFQFFGLMYKNITIKGKLVTIN